MEGVLTSLKTSKHLRSQLRAKRLRFEGGKSGDALLGVYGSREPSFSYLGFEFHGAAAPKLSLYVKRSIKGKRNVSMVPRKLKKNYSGRDFARGQTWFSFTQSVDERFNGDAEAMRRWFHETSKLVPEMDKK
jgi:hypothetical protein